MSKDQFILVIGNPIDGLGFEGPFDSEHAATDYAEERLRVEWWVAGLNVPGER